MRLMSSYRMYGVALQVATSPATWLLLPVLLVAAALPDVVLRALRDSVGVAARAGRRPDPVSGAASRRPGLCARQWALRRLTLGAEKPRFDSLANLF